MAEQSSRLHRLLTLLDTGSSQATRFAAARQIGDIARLHPQDLNSLLKKVSQYLRSKNWDTRVAAAHAIGSIAENVKHTSLKELFTMVEMEMSEAGLSENMEMMGLWNFHPETISGLSFSGFEIGKVLEFGAPLLASGGQEYDAVNDNKNPAERLTRQKQNLRRRLGLDVCEQFMDVSDVIRDEDLLVNRVPSHVNGVHPGYYTSQSGQHIHNLVATMVPGFISKRLSARELNLLKRKAKVNVKDHVKGWVDDEDSEVPPSQTSLIPKSTSLDPLQCSKISMEAMMDDDSFIQDGVGRWPFGHFVEQLIHDVFDPIWDVRHGSIMALREILTHQAASAGVFMPDLASEDSWYSDFGSKINMTSTMKRDREIDLNIQCSVEDSEPCLKRQKSEDESGQLLNGEPSCCRELNPGVGVKYDIKYEDALSHPSHGIENNVQNMVTVKVEAESSVDGSYFQCPKVEEDGDGSQNKAFSKDTRSSTQLDIATKLPENEKLLKLVNLAKISWAKNWEFLQDCAIRFLCVLSLDRFGDYVSDQVVAPVRETCAQALGAVLKYMHPSLVHGTLNVLLQMQYRQEWEIRHGSLLGLKYLVAVRQEMLQDLLVYVLPACKAGLGDPDDDVRAVAAEALIPTARAIVSLKGQTLHSIVMLLWDILLDLDDLSPSTSSVMHLLAEIYSQPEVVPETLGVVEHQGFDLNEVVPTDENGDSMKLEENTHILSTLAPRLWPFMRHSITSVRHAAIRTLERLLEAGSRRQSSDETSTSSWPASILGDTLRIVFQNLLLESNEEILQCSVTVWRLLLQCPVEELGAAANSYFSSWLQLATTPFGSVLDSTKMFCPAFLPRKSHFRAAAKMRAVKGETGYHGNFGLDPAKEIHSQEQFLDASTNSTKIVVGADSEKSVTRTRVVASTALGVLVSHLSEASLPFVVNSLWENLSSSSGVQRQVASMVLVAWFKELKYQDTPSMHASVIRSVTPLRQLLIELLACTDPAMPTKDSFLPYSELSRTYMKMRNEANLLFRAADSSGLFENVLTSLNFSADTVGVEDAISFGSKLSPRSNHTIGDGTVDKQVLDDIESCRQRLLSTSGYLKCVQSNLHITVSSLLASAVTWMSELPARLNPIILPLMAAVKREQEEVLQQKAAEALAELISFCIVRKPGPNDKLIKNLCTLTCLDPCETPQAALLNSMETIDDQDLLSFGKGTSTQKSKVQMLSSGEERSRAEGFISRRGAEIALKCLCERFGASLFDQLPKLWECLTEVLKPSIPDGSQSSANLQNAQHGDLVDDPQALINNLQVVCSIAPLLDETLKTKLVTLFPCIFDCIRHKHIAVRLAASRCITAMAKTMTTSVMGAVMESALPLLRDSVSVHARQGAGMLVSLLVQGLGAELVPYAPLLVVNLLGCMSDSDRAVRQSVTHSFAALVPLLPLARGLRPPVGVSESLSRTTEDAHFLEQLLDNSHVDDYKLSFELKVTLRRYQQEGINWLSFLRRFKLHGILCDDMGLGKTLQASAIVASDTVEQLASNNDKDNLLSLIICPSTLVGHWAFEIEKFIDSSIINPLQYVGSAQDRVALRSQFGKYNVIITSYDVIRKDIDHLGQLVWNYCILDEGHVIKNSKSKITCAVKQLKAEHRLILSGTPIQNNVLELWSLFDFLMPGFLGTERQFQATYGKPLLAAKDSKCSAKDAEAGALAMEALHKQVMPFLLRRTKDEVLSDLPEKIIQDRYCDLSPIQLRLYEQFSTSNARKEISSLMEANEQPSAPVSANPSSKASSHVFQALQYLLKLCSHPLLVLGEKPSDSLLHMVSEVISGGGDITSNLHDLQHSPKLVALKEILEECGIGMETSGSEGAVIGGGQHRVLIFAQHKSLLDIIERDLFHTHMKSVTYLRLDGSVEPERRFEIVKAFNSDPTIDVLLLTTHVGGLGLNLTSADTLVFMEHDWNPMRDHQAMDRAHRLGQRKVVNVHRLIMRGTLEEKVMSLQKFKVSVANAVINAENASLKTMDTSQLLDLFTTSQPSRQQGAVSSKSSNGENADTKSIGGGRGIKSILSGLGELWDESQYSDEYNVSQFLARLNS
ncbi:TATA-binding protein-associated factor BTAF1 isoform X1 [Amborella trichopoda]|uniref:TATA-binding protein-associated factor BTAF1 isoform X1 n=1 Tax=Amborella trichopoda TaxID=13333 RepID=UPI0005D3995A|nr:TATA-binding protein-associated factor BTAF1 isoform X1 [Amborella trichopoda]|eukprot:XP_011621494.1 TATA-binding protein-associated factor BTAF1 isoform X1 [Amborella trichopoda]